MKFTAVFPLLPVAAIASKGIHLRNTPIVEENSPDVFNSIVEVLDQCPEQTASLSTCYGGYPNMLTCADCAWARVLREINLGCTSIDAIATADYGSCVDNPSSACNHDCAIEVRAVWNCAKALYCGSEEENFLDSSVGCFSLKSTVEVQGKGTVAVKDLHIGDMVLSNEHGAYSMYYSKGHFVEDEPTAFLQIFTETSTKRPLELTDEHLVYKDSTEAALPFPARSIKVGDNLKTINGSSKVTAIKKVTRKGLSNPLTMSGSIVVDGVVASAYTDKAGHKGEEPGWLYIMNRKLIHRHSLAHFVMAPHRMVCGRLMSCDESLSEGGRVPYVNYVTGLNAMAVGKQSTFFNIAILSFLTIQSILFALVEELIQHSFAFMLIVLGVAAAKWSVTIKVKSYSKTKSV